MASMSQSDEEDIALSDNDEGSSSTNLDQTSDQLPLVPTDFSNVQEALQNFTVVFESRYGGLHPRFQTCSLRSALSEAFGSGGSIASIDQRPLAIYLHNDNAIAHNIFAERVLCSEAIYALLNCQFVVWPWDMTQGDNRTKLFEWLDENSLKDFRVAVTRYSKDEFPLLFVINKDRAQYEFEQPIKGADTNDTAMEKLLSGLDRFQEIKNRSLAEEQRRIEREQMRQEQVTAYEESLAKDRAKQEEVTRQREQANAQLQEEQRRQEAKQQRQSELAASLPPEPSAADAGTITIRVRTPNGDAKMRNFEMSNTLSHLLQYIESLGFEMSEHRVFTSDMPRKDVANLDSTKTFTELGWSRRETITVNPQ